MIIYNLSMPVKKSNSETKRNPKCIVSSCFSNFKFDNQSDKKVKVIGIDIDWTIIRPKEGRTFNRDKDDWDWLFGKDIIFSKIKEKYQDGYLIMFITNQSKAYKIPLIDSVLAEFDSAQIPYICIIGNPDIKKPSKALFDSIFEFLDVSCTNLTADMIDYSNSYYVGDAGGREGDWANSDLEFSKNIGFQFMVPEDFFDISIVQRGYQSTTDYTGILNRLIDENKTIVAIMVGYPCSGKSSFALTELCHIYDLQYIEGDKLKTSKKMIGLANHLIDEEGFNGVVFDATNSTIIKRKEYVDFARSYASENNKEVSVVTFVMDTNIDKAMTNNLIRSHCLEKSKVISKVVFYVYRKKFEPVDSEAEDMNLVVHLSY